MAAFPRIFLPLPVLPAAVATPAELDAALAAAAPDTHAALHQAVREHDIVCIAPGGKFLDGYHYQNALAAAAAASVQGKPYAMLHQSLGPLQPAPRRTLLAGMLEQARIVLLRESHSHRFALQLTGGRAPCHLTADPLLALPPLAATDPAYDLGLNFRLAFNGWVSPDDVLQFVRELQAGSPLRIRMYTTTHPLQDPLCASLRELGVDCLPRVIAPPDLLAVPGHCRVNLTDSFHGVIFSLLAGRAVVPCQADFDSWKLQGTFPNPWWAPRLHPGPTSPEQRRSLHRRVRRALNAPPRLPRRISRLLDRRRSEALAGWDALRHVLRQG